MAKRTTRRVLVVIDRAILDVASVPEVVLEAEARADEVQPCPGSPVAGVG